MGKKTISGKLKEETYDDVTSKIENMDENQSEFVRKAVKQRMRRLSDE